ncbi:NADH pyrophosphatase [Roseovarius albus]|uniref:NAD(+) diphosphatase n=1 Tax=Roseovarius albus TaxID=1247867 RepID=A0A1X6Y4M7_9RHOB|nr:NAD(+) diphosphatase [Roseovarius albus]SLN10209.1 NADH pyrophosphatase [Roseovarius albus]
MFKAESVTFGGTGLDRAAELRGQEDALKQLIAEGQAETILLWNGKPLVSAENLDQLIYLRMDEPVLKKAQVPPILLGRSDSGTLVFAYDISAWSPDESQHPVSGGFADDSLQAHPDIPQPAVFAELRRIMFGLSAQDAELATTAKAVFGWHVSHRFCACCGHESQMVMSGWQRLCPSCKSPHFPRTDPVVIMLITHGNSVLVGRSPGWPDRVYSLLAGFVEPGETVEAAVRREVYEEVNVHVGEVSYLASQPWAFPSSLMFGMRGEALSTQITLDPVELEDAAWLSREEMAQVFAGEHSKYSAARKGSIAHFLLLHWLAGRI